MRDKYLHRLTLIFRAARVHDALEMMRFVHDILVERGYDQHEIAAAHVAVTELTVQDLTLTGDINGDQDTQD